jgi:transcriptional regulator with XRE-family HTH domain
MRPQPQIAERVGVTLRAYQEWEAGGGIAWPNLEKLADIHGVSTDWLEHGDEQPVPAPSQLDRIERKLDEVLSRIGAVSTGDLFGEPRDETDNALDERRGSRDRRAG